MVSGKTRRPPYWSAHIPKKTLTSEPVRIGVPTRRPNWVSLSPNSALISIPIMAKIVQTAKQTVKAVVLSQRAPCCCCGVTVDETMTCPFCGENNLVLR